MLFEVTVFKGFSRTLQLPFSCDLVSHFVSYFVDILLYRSLTHLNHIHDCLSRNPHEAHIVNTLPVIIMLTVTLKRKLIQSNVKLISLLLIMEVSLNLKQM